MPRIRRINLKNVPATLSMLQAAEDVLRQVVGSDHLNSDDFVLLLKSPTKPELQGRGYETLAAETSPLGSAPAFDRLTAACNSCHQSANCPFIVIQPPQVLPLPISLSRRDATSFCLRLRGGGAKAAAVTQPIRALTCLIAAFNGKPILLQARP